MTDEDQKYLPWVAHNAGPDTKSPVPKGTPGEVHTEDSVYYASDNIEGFDWTDQCCSPIIRYRVEAVPKLVTLFGNKKSNWTYGCRAHDTHSITLVLNPDGTPMKNGTYTSEKL